MPKSKEIQKVEPVDDETAIERVLISGDLGGLSPDQRVSYYHSVCKSTGLNPLTKPFAYIKLNGKLVLYALKGCTDQLRAVNNISVTIVHREIVGDIYTVTARATCKGRQDEDEGAVDIRGLRGESLANAHMKALTKAKRRVTLSLVGLGMLDETEAETIPGARVVPQEDFGNYARGESVPYAELTGDEAAGNGPDAPIKLTRGLSVGVVEVDLTSLGYWSSQIGNCESSPNVRDALADASGSLSKSDFEELQMHANEHIDFIGGES